MRIRIHPSFPVWMVVSMVFGCTGTESPTGIAQPEPPAFAANAGMPLQAGVFRATFDAPLCGIDVTVSLFDAGTAFDPVAPGGPPSKETGILKMTLVAANGQSVQFTGTGVITRAVGPLSDEGTFLAVSFSAGIVKFSTPPGSPLSHDAGRIIFELLVRPEQGGGFTVLSAEIVEVSGPHLRLLSLEPVPGSFFCEVVTDALT